MSTLVFKKSLELRLITRAKFSADVVVLEQAEPYTLSFQITSQASFAESSEEELECDLAVDSKQIARELKRWLGSHGGSLRASSSCYVLKSDVEDAMLKYVRFGLPPSQKHLIYWILSRVEITPPASSGHPCLIVFGSQLSASDVLDRSDLITSPRVDALSWTNSFDVQEKTSTRTLNALRRSDSFADNGNLSESMLGKSQSLEALKTHSIKGRAAAADGFCTSEWDDDTHRLVNNIQSHRRKIINQLEESSMLLDRTKQECTLGLQKLRSHRDRLSKAGVRKQWVRQADEEVKVLQQTEEEVRRAVLRERVRLAHESRVLSSTIAPNGFNMRGQSKPGVYLGPGPVSFSSTTRKHNAAVEKIAGDFYWDEAGRRHSLEDVPILELGDCSSSMETAMQAIRRAAANAHLYKLDLHEVFTRMDTSGDGFLSLSELTDAFRNLGLQLSENELESLFKFFDPNNSGKIGYGEFMWAFFNRRKFVRHWSKSVSRTSKEELMARFHLADMNGDGKLSVREFKKLLRMFQITLSDQMVEVLMKRFDRDANGTLDLEEYLHFIEEEQGKLIVTKRGDTSRKEEMSFTGRPESN